MYSHIHPKYVAQCQDLLAEVGFASSKEVRFTRQLSLANYSRGLSAKLVERIEKVQLLVMDLKAT